MGKKKIEAHEVNWEDLISKGIEVDVRSNNFGYYLSTENFETYFRRVSYFLKGIPSDWKARWSARVVAETAAENIATMAGWSRDTIVEYLKQSPWKKRDEAADRGTAIHAAIEAFVKDAPLPDNLTDDQSECAFHLEAFLRANDVQPIASEMTVLSPKYGYCGTLDLWGKSPGPDGNEVILDFKTGAGVYDEYSIQLTAYLGAEYAVHNGRVIKWFGGDDPPASGVVHVTPEGAEYHGIIPSDRLWQVWRAAQTMREWQRDVDSFRSPAKDPAFSSPMTYIKDVA